MEQTIELDTWVKFVMELQTIAQNEMAYTKDVFDHERFERIREISAVIISMKTGISLHQVKEVFCNEVGYQPLK